MWGGGNNFIPFCENEIAAKESFKSDFMFKFINGKIPNEFESAFIPTKALNFSKEAKAVLDAGRAIFKHYHANATSKNPTQNPLNLEYNANASLYDIKEHFKGRGGKNNKINDTSKDEKFNELETNLSKALKTIATKITPKIYEYGFLKE